MKTIIMKIAEKHDFDLMADEAMLKLTMPSMMPLVIEKVGARFVTVSHYYEQNGDLCPDPDMKFFMQLNLLKQASQVPGKSPAADYDWVPVEITQVSFMMMGHQLGGYRPCATMNYDGDKIASIYPRAMKEIAAFGNSWAAGIREQNWLERGERVVSS